MSLALTHYLRIQLKLVTTWRIIANLIIVNVQIYALNNAWHCPLFIVIAYEMRIVSWDLSPVSWELTVSPDKFKHFASVGV